MRCPVMRPSHNMVLAELRGQNILSCKNTSQACPFVADNNEAEGTQHSCTSVSTYVLQSWLRLEPMALHSHS